MKLNKVSEMVEVSDDIRCTRYENKGNDMVNISEKEIDTELKLNHMIKACDYFILSLKYCKPIEKFRLRSICDKYIKIGEDLKIQLAKEKDFFNS